MKVWNTEVVQNKIFPNNLKVADITPIFKKGDSTLEKNYRPCKYFTCSFKNILNESCKNKYLIT